MGRREGDLDICLHLFLVLFMVIYGIGGLVNSHPLGISSHPSNQIILADPPSSIESSLHAPRSLNVPIATITSGTEPLPPIVLEAVLSALLNPPLSMVVTPQIGSQTPGIPQRTNSFPNPPCITPPSPKHFAPNIHAIGPSMPGSIPLACAENISPGSISSQGSQAPNVFHSSDHYLSPLNASPPSTLIRSGAPIDETQGRPPSGSLLTLPHAAAPAPRIGLLTPPVVQRSIPRIAPSMVSQPGAEGFKGPVMSPMVAPSVSTSRNLSPANHSQVKGLSPVVSPKPYESNSRHASSDSHPHPSDGRNRKSSQPTPDTAVPGHKDGKRGNLEPAPFYLPPSSPSDPYFPHVQAPISSPRGDKSSSHASSPTTRQNHNRWPINYPAPSPSYFKRKSQSPLSQPILALPPPPPNLNCGPITCHEPLVNPASGSLCACVLPIKVGLSLGVALYTFFPLVSEFAQEIASGIFVKQSQVRIIGANAASEFPERTVVLIDLVPLGKSFDNRTLFLTYEKFWHKQVDIEAKYFGDYDVSYLLYPGLPPAPPAAPASSNVEEGSYRNNYNGRVIRPLGVDVRKKKGKMKLSGSLIAIIVLSSVISLVLVGVAWFLLSRCREHSFLPSASCHSLQLPFSELSAARTVPMTAGSRPCPTSASFSSSIATYTGSAKKFSLFEIERITNKFDNSRIIGEGGFGRVYQGTIEDGTRVAVKVLKRVDQQGGKEFLAEVEMLSRLHHRNLVKLIGICSEENTRCLIYELVPNGSVESHLHGVDKVNAPLDWHARMMVALGAARGLAYLHEDSSPHVIHRDFKSTNILLEHDFTPKVSDFGLARTARDEGNEHISTRVMGTFGYVAPEYAMTGHLLVKSDVYSYGVVLLELLTGRKPVDMSQPPGQENLVSWARPLLAKVEMIVDPALGNSYPHDCIAKVMAIASMCVEPEALHRPFMGEVVQALKLVCSESDECRHSKSCSNDGSLSMKETGISKIDIGLCQGSETDISQSNILYTSEGFTGNDDASGLFRMHSSSGPIRTGRGWHFLHRVGGLASRSLIEHRFAHRLWSRSEHGERLP